MWFRNEKHIFVGGLYRLNTTDVTTNIRVKGFDGKRVNYTMLHEDGTPARLFNNEFMNASSFRRVYRLIRMPAPMFDGLDI